MPVNLSTDQKIELLKALSPIVAAVVADSSVYHKSNKILVGFYSRLLEELLGPPKESTK